MMTDGKAIAQQQAALQLMMTSGFRMMNLKQILVVASAFGSRAVSLLAEQL
jgi:hypothetical protein